MLAGGLGDLLRFRHDSIRWLIALLVVAVVTTAVGLGVWLLCSRAWHWPRADVIAATAVVVLGLIALGIAPATSWAAGDSGDSRANRDVATERDGGSGPSTSVKWAKANRDIIVNVYGGGPVPQGGHVRGDPRLMSNEVARSVAPTSGLIGRDAELGELAAFCDDEGRSFLWWQADAWAGKSALLASFVVSPPPGVLPVSFFITAAQAGQNTSVAFLRDVTAQLEALSGTSQPPASTHGQVANLDWLLRECARLASEDGRRLVLVVDGLDEDGSRADGLRSVASMLPKRLEHGSKVIVSGRRNPGLPGDVPADHPLRDPGVVRVLSESEHSIARRDIAAEELAHLLDGGPGLQRAMLGFLVAARGGLTAEDMADLAEVLPHEVEKVLASPAGRTFAPRPFITTRGIQKPAFIFSHEELSGEAESKLGKALVEKYREKLHHWAAGYQDCRWPAETPAYLLRGYGEMLRHHDGPRLVALAADGGRIDRMLDITGSDADAIAEVGAAIDFAAARRNADLATIALLAYQRDRLTDRNIGLPARLPAAWARAGQYPRAESMARDFGGESRVQALAWTSIALHDRGEKETAARLMEMACNELQQLPGRSSGYPALAGAAAAALARGGELERAETMLAAIDDVRDRDLQLVQVAACMARAGEATRAEEMAESTDAVLVRVRALAGAAEGLAFAGQSGHATRLASAAEALAWSAGDADTRDAALAVVASAMAVSGQHDRAAALAADVSEPGARGEALAGVAAALATPERSELAMRLVSAAESLLSEAEAGDGESPSFSRQRATGDLAQAYAGAGELNVAEDLAHLRGTIESRVHCLIGIGEKLACAGQADEAVRVLSEAETVARGGSALKALANALITTARALTTAGATGQATELLADVQAVIAGPLRNEVSPLDLALALATAGEGERCAAVAGAIRDLQAREYAMASSAIQLADAGKPSTALDLAGRVLDPKVRAWAYPPVIAAMARTRDFQQAERLATGLPDAKSRAQALTSVAVGHALAGQQAAALILLDEIDDQRARYEALAAIAPALAPDGKSDEALALSNLPDQKLRSRVLAEIAQGLAETGHAARARQLAETITRLWWRAAALAWVADADAVADTAVQGHLLTEVDELLVAARQADQEEHERQGHSVLWFPSTEQSAAAWAASTAFARAGQTERAVRAAGLVPHPKSRRRALEKVAVTLAEAGHAEAAMDLAETGRFRSPKAQVLGKIAVALAQAEQHTRVRDPLVTAMRTGHWNSWISALGKISMPDLLQLAESLHSQFRLALSAGPH